MNGDFQYRGGEQLPLRAAARRAISNGVIPTQKHIGTWGGFGCGARCCICGEAIRVEQLEFEIDFPRAGAATAESSYHLHAACFHAWEAERETLVGGGLTKVLKAEGDESTIPLHDREDPSRRGFAE
jgi:hypothetical protein